ncbi:MAG TPA: DUF624 domain-containing protein [Candidatus Cryosericum sp.]|nr:DUF624 domain-containing protein [Candidatus Cryosericum sp.]
MAAQSRDLWERLAAKRFAPGKGVTDPPPQDGWKRFFFILGTHFWKMVQLNLLFLAFSIPIVTIPAAFCGMNRALIKLYRDGNCFVWEEFFKEFKANLFKAIPFGIIGGLCLFASYYFLSLGTSVSSDGVEIFSIAVGILLFVFAVLFANYSFVFLPTLDLKNKQIARNAFIFLITEWKTNLVILAVAAATTLLSVLLFPYTLILLVFLSFSFMQYVICIAVNNPLQKRIIGPYEERENDHVDL